MIENETELDEWRDKLHWHLTQLGKNTHQMKFLIDDAYETFPESVQQIYRLVSDLESLIQQTTNEVYAFHSEKSSEFSEE